MPILQTSSLTLPIHELHLFAGGGGGILGGMLLGHEPVCAVEIKPYCRAQLLQRQRDGILPWFPIWDDVRTFDGRPWRGRANAICGGFPCQDISANGNGDGLDGERSGLWAEMRRIIGEVEPTYVFVENSPMLTVRGLGSVLGDLATMGYDARWGVVGAVHADAAHERERIWILAYPTMPRREANESVGNAEKIPLLGCNADVPGRWGRWPSESGLVRVADGVANRVERLHALGNGQVPRVAAIAWDLLKPKK